MYLFGCLHVWLISTYEAGKKEVFAPQTVLFQFKSLQKE